MFSTRAINKQLTAENATVGISNVPFRFGVDHDGNYGYILTDESTGADTVIPFKKGGESPVGAAIYTDVSGLSFTNVEYTELVASHYSSNDYHNLYIYYIVVADTSKPVIGTTSGTYKRSIITLKLSDS